MLVFHCCLIVVLGSRDTNTGDIPRFQQPFYLTTVGTNKAL
jgi:hypothetical protein